MGNSVAGAILPLTSNIKRPHDLEALEHGEDLVVYLEPFPACLPGEIASMGIDPPVSRAVAFALVPSKCLIDLGQRLNRYLGGSPINRGHPAPSSIITKSPGFGIRALTSATPPFCH
jgi:hypothetical protein